MDSMKLIDDALDAMRTVLLIGTQGSGILEFVNCYIRGKNIPPDNVLHLVLNRPLEYNILIEEDLLG
ncbi:MAG: hypothetical protein QXL15_04980, partial [Candidatus Korarchaeota archaeon]